MTVSGDEAAPLIEEILQDSLHSLTLFTREELQAIELFQKRNKPYLQCTASGKDRPAKPEEIVRQLYIRRLIEAHGYPKERIEVEKPVYFGSTVHEKSADIVVTDEDDPDSAYIIVEVKKAKRSDGLEQLKSYCNAEGSPIGVWTNGGQIIFLHREDPNLFRGLAGIPNADQTLEQLVEERWTLKDLQEHNRLLTERMTLKGVILDMENLVLANAGVDAFEEIFKLIYSKLYDEWASARGKGDRYLEFRIGGSTPTQFYDRIDRLFQAAKKQWPGVFFEDEGINLTPNHLVTCGSFLEDIKLFNSNLQIIDEAFEYLSTEVGKKRKGQYFTPRHVIDMCVKMLNPTADEYVIDTAAGSCGFTVHSIFHVWGDEFTATGPLPWQSEYARERVYGIDFDPRSVKIAKALNLIAGDGKTNVFKANSLDTRDWDEEIRAAFKNRLRKLNKGEDKRNRETYRYFDFDVLLTNPPFAGKLKDTRLLHQYDLARNLQGKWKSQVGRDILFIERNLQFLKPGGRAAIVLPQGRFNNLTDSQIREYIDERARILAVVGLHGNTFKPHTTTKTSVLFLQTWNDDPRVGPLNPKADDYDIFFAVSEKSGKDNKGEYIYLEDDFGRPELDEHGHLIVDHDLELIVEAFAEFARSQNFTFAENQK